LVLKPCGPVPVLGRGMVDVFGMTRFGFPGLGIVGLGVNPGLLGEVPGMPKVLSG